MSSKQISFQGVSGWGGYRRGAGRKNLTGTVNHMKRPEVNISKPLHITLRLNPGLPNLRKNWLLKEFKKSAANAKTFGFYVVHFSLLSNHIHMIVEARGNRCLAQGMRSLAGRFAKRIRLVHKAREASFAQKRLGPIRELENEPVRKEMPITYPIFKGRYHLHVLKTPTEMKRALEYVLLNQAKHSKLIEHLDPFSSGHVFKDWDKLLGRRFRYLIKDQVNERQDDPQVNIHLSPAQSWLCTRGWLRVV